LINKNGALYSSSRTGFGNVCNFSEVAGMEGKTNERVENKKGGGERKEGIMPKTHNPREYSFTLKKWFSP